MINCEELSVYEIQVILKEVLPKLTINFRDKVVGIRYIVMPQLYNKEISILAERKLTENEKDALSSHFRIYYQDSMQDLQHYSYTYIDWKLGYWRKFVKCLQVSSSNFDQVCVAVKIKQKGLQKEKARQKSQQRAKDKQLVNFTWPDQQSIGKRVNEFFRIQCDEALRQASVQMGIDQIVTPSITTRISHKYPLLKYLTTYGSKKPSNFDTSGKALHEELKTLPFYKEVMDHLLHVTTKSSFSSYQDRAAACRRFAILYSENSADCAIGMIDSHELVRKLSIKRNEAI